MKRDAWQKLIDYILSTAPDSLKEEAQKLHEKVTEHINDSGPIHLENINSLA